MDELKKVRRVCDKAMPGAPHETWMVLDATTGQNAISQAKTFKADMEITGIVLTKLDGSAKGGVVLGICDELKVPVRYRRCRREDRRSAAVRSGRLRRRALRRRRGDRDGLSRLGPRATCGAAGLSGTR